MLPDSLSDQWRAARREMVIIPDIHVSRSTKPCGTKGDQELIGFWDGADPTFCHAVQYICDGRKQFHFPKVKLIYICRLVQEKVRVCNIKKSSTPRSEMCGLVLLTWLVSAILPELTHRPIRLSLLGYSECTITSVEFEQYILAPYFSNKSAEVLEHMEGWRTEGYKVDQIHHWPGSDNIADLGT